MILKKFTAVSGIVTGSLSLMLAVTFVAFHAEQVFAYDAVSNGGSSIISTGAFTSAGIQNGLSIPAGVNSAATFKAYISGLLNRTGGNTQGIPQSYYNAVGAAFIIETMLNGQGTYAANDDLIRAGQRDYSVWASYIDYYGSHNRVNWSTPNAYTTNYLNSEHVCINGHGGCTDNRVYGTGQNDGNQDAKLFGFFTSNRAEGGSLIVFTNDDGSTFTIRRDCANVLGSASPLTNHPPVWSLGALSSVSSSGGGSMVSSDPTSSSPTVYPGETATFEHDIYNNGPDTASFHRNVQANTDRTTSGTVVAGTDGDSSVDNANHYHDTETWSPNAGTSDGSYYCQFIAYDPTKSPTGADDRNGRSGPVCVKVQQPVCQSASITTNPSNPSPGTPFSAQVNLNYGSTRAANSVRSGGGQVVITITPTSGSPTSYNVTPTASGNYVVANQNLTYPSGSYTISFTVSGVGGGGSSSCFTSGNSTNILIGYYPYFTVTGGDATAGKNYYQPGNVCTPSTTGDISGWNTNNGDGTGYFGASVQLGAFALGKLNSVPSATNSDGTSAIASGGSPTSTSFAGTPGAVHGTVYGGQYSTNGVSNGTYPTCSTDYVSAFNNADATTLSSANPIDPTTLASGLYKVTDGDAHIAASTTMPFSRKIIIMVIGHDAYVDSSINYQPGYSTTVGSVDIPSFGLYTKAVGSSGGDIHILNTVQTLHGTFVAQPNNNGTSGGTLSTCYDSSGLDSSDYATCKHPLTFYGAVSAKNLELRRTYGDYKGVGPDGRTPAEHFTYTPEYWLSAIGDPITGTTKAKYRPYDSINSVPPIL